MDYATLRKAWLERTLAPLEAKDAPRPRIGMLAGHVDRLTAVAMRYADRRFEAGRRVAEFQVYERLFSLWHVLHIPLFFMLLIAGIVHVIAINIY